jgi:hypothetical protein
MRWLRLLIVPVGFIILGRRAKFTPNQWIISSAQAIAIFAGGSAIAHAHPIIQYIAPFCFFGAVARMYWLLGQRCPNTRIRDQSDKCSLGVFMGSGNAASVLRKVICY